MILVCVVLICSSLVDISKSEFRTFYECSYSATHREGYPKLLKVLDWLVMEENDSDRRKMTKERVDKFVNFVFRHQNSCVVTGGKRVVSCEKLRGEIDHHKFEAGTEGISFNEKMKSVGKKINGFLGSHDINTVQPYGVLLLLDWALEFGNARHTRLPRGGHFPQPGTRALVKFIINHKDALWARIDEGKRLGVKPLVEFFVDNQDLVGWQEEKPTARMLCGAFRELQKSKFTDADSLMAKSGQAYCGNSPTRASVSQEPANKENDPCEKF